jgi:hypothetical protein
MGNGTQKRYRAETVTLSGKTIYITTQWFEDNRADIISWYKEHLKKK